MAGPSGEKCGSPPAWMSTQAAVYRSSSFATNLGSGPKGPSLTPTDGLQRCEAIRFRMGVRVGALAHQERYRLGVSKESGVGQAGVSVLVQRRKLRAGLHQQPSRTPVRRHGDDRTCCGNTSRGSAVVRGSLTPCHRNTRAVISGRLARGGREQQRCGERHAGDRMPTPRGPGAHGALHRPELGSQNDSTNQDP